MRVMITFGRAERVLCGWIYGTNSKKFGELLVNVCLGAA